MAGKVFTYAALSTPSSTSLGAWANGATKSVYALLNPTGAYYNGSYDYPLILTNYALNDIAVHFREFRFNYAYLEYEPKIGPSETDSELKQRITLAYTAAPTEVLQNITTTAQAQRARSVQFPSWKPTMFTGADWRSMRNDRDKRLYKISANQDVYSTDGLLDTHNQGAFIAVGSDLTATSQKSLGSVTLHFEVDLYGFSTANLTADTQRLSLQERLVDRADEKEKTVSDRKRLETDGSEEKHFKSRVDSAGLSVSPDEEFTLAPTPPPSRSENQARKSGESARVRSMK